MSKIWVEIEYRLYLAVKEVCIIIVDFLIKETNHER